MRAKEFIPASKPRNFVAKNAMKTTSGAGQHRDKKKEQKQGYEKHKGQGIAEARKVKGGDYQLKLVDRQEDDTTDLDDVVTDYYFDVYQNGQKVGHAQGDSYYGELVVKTDFNREFKLDTYHDKDHPLIQQFEKFQQQFNEFAPGPGREDDPNDLTDEAFKDGQRLGFSLVDGATRAQGFKASRYLDRYLIPFAYGWNSGRKMKIKQAQKDGVALTMKKDGSLVRAEQGVAEGDDVASAEVLLKRYELLTQSIRNAIDQRDYNEKSKHIEQVRDALEKHYGIDPDKVNEEATSGEPQEYTVRVVDEENSGYTVKVTATSEQGALHKAIVRVRNSGARPEHARIIRQGVAEASFTAAASMHAATRKQDPQRQEPKHDFRVGDKIVTKKGNKPGEVVFVDGEKIHVKGTNPYYPDHITHHTASELKKGVAEGESALEKFRKAAAEREKKHDEIEAKRKAAAKQGKENMSGAIDRLEKHLSNK